VSRQESSAGGMDEEMMDVDQDRHDELKRIAQGAQATWVQPPPQQWLHHAPPTMTQQAAPASWVQSGAPTVFGERKVQAEGCAGERVQQHQEEQSQQMLQQAHAMAHQVQFEHHYKQQYQQQLQQMQMQVPQRTRNEFTGLVIFRVLCSPPSSLAAPPAIHRAHPP
jgi:hypothetical protein